MLSLNDPIQRFSLSVEGAGRIAGKLMDVIAAGVELAVDTHHDTLRAEPAREFIDQLRPLQGGRVDRDLLCASTKHGFSVGDRADAARDTEGDVEYLRNATHPVAIDRTTLGTGGDVIEHQFVGALIPVTARQFQDVADRLVFAEAHTFNHLTVADVEAGDYAARKNGCNSSAGNRSSSRALPLMAAATPVVASACKSAILETPPEACH